MIIERPRNTKEKGAIEFIVYREGKTYVGVCLTFDIIEEGDNPTELMKSIKEAAGLHLETVIKQSLSDELLNRHAPAEYWNRYFKAAKNIEKPSIAKENNLSVSPYYCPLNTTAQMA